MALAESAAGQNIPLIVLPEDRTKELIVIIMGSSSDRSHADIIKGELDTHFGIHSTMGVFSAHKNTPELLEVITLCNPIQRLGYIAIAGGSNALGGVIEMHTTHPVISAPPLTSPYGWIDIFSSIRQPSGMGAFFVMEAKQTAIAAAKLFTNSNPEIKAKVAAYQEASREKNTTDNRKLQREQLGLLPEEEIT